MPFGKTTCIKSAAPPIVNPSLRMATTEASASSLGASYEPTLLPWSFPAPQGSWEGYPHPSTCLPFVFITAKPSAFASYFDSAVFSRSLHSIRRHEDRLPHSWRNPASSPCWVNYSTDKILSAIETW